MTQKDTPPWEAGLFLLWQNMGTISSDVFLTASAVGKVSGLVGLEVGRRNHWVGTNFQKREAKDKLPSCASDRPQGLSPVPSEHLSLTDEMTLCMPYCSQTLSRSWCNAHSYSGRQLVPALQVWKHSQRGRATCLRSRKEETQTVPPRQNCVLLPYTSSLRLKILINSLEGRPAKMVPKWLCVSLAVR